MPRRAEIAAAAAVAGLAAGILLAPLALALAVAFGVFGRVTRLRPHWLLVPAVAGVAAVLAVGPRSSLAGLAAVPRHTTTLLAGTLSHPAVLSRLAGIPLITEQAGLRQLPSAVLLATAAAAAVGVLRWGHPPRPGGRALPPYRAGLVIRWRRWRTAAFIRAGGILTRDGVALGTDLNTGRAAAVSWQQAGGGVVVTGSDPAAVAAAGFQITAAAIRRRKPVVIVDLDGLPWLPAALAGLCAAVGAPLLTCGPGSTARYEPLRDASPGRAAALLMGTGDWSGVPEPGRRSCLDCLATAFGLLATAPVTPEAVVLGQLAGLIQPGAMRAAVARVPAWHPAAQGLAARVHAAEHWLASDPATAGLLARQLTALHTGPAGRWLGPGTSAGPRFCLGDVIRQRAAVLFAPCPAAAGARLPGPGPAETGAETIASLVALDLAARYDGLHRQGIAPDGLAWFSRCEAVSPAALAGLAAGPADARTGLAAVLTTTSPQAGRLAGQMTVCLAHRIGDRRLAAQIAEVTRPASVRPGQDAPGQEVSEGTPCPSLGETGACAVTAESLCGLPPDQFVLLTAGRVARRGRAVAPAVTP